MKSLLTDENLCAYNLLEEGRNVDHVPKVRDDDDGDSSQKFDATANVDEGHEVPLFLIMLLIIKQDKWLEMAEKRMSISDKERVMAKEMKTTSHESSNNGNEDAHGFLETRCFKIKIILSQRPCSLYQLL